MNKIKKNDKVIATTGRDAGRTGTVLAVVDGGERLIVEGINMVKKHVKANPQANEKGGIVPKALSIHRSNVKIYNEATQKGDKVGIRILEDGRKVRYFKSTNAEIEV
jgi:large subunit ribosomal protein L24